MVFSSSLFLFFFFPITLLLYYILKPWRVLQNIHLVLVSLLFYAWGEPQNIVLMLISIIVNWLLGIIVDKYKISNKLSFFIISITVLFNIGILFYFKYLDFFTRMFGYDVKNATELPIGISFFTFQAISYVVDIYRGNGAKQVNPLNVALYISFFPQLIAGPIVRYETVAEQIKNRKETVRDFIYGLERFIIGFSKKLLLANSFAPIADFCFNNLDKIATPLAWLGAICYTLQIYFDFSGYSDMAIGLGRMFGFKFNENFNNPYISSSVTEFWRRWHISLSSYFKDYVYIPLGGSHVNSSIRRIFNLFVVWLLTGLWHGANYTFLLWGLWYFVLLVIEKYACPPLRNTIVKAIMAHFYTIIAFVIGWVIFRAENASNAIKYLSKMFSVGDLTMDPFSLYMYQDISILLILGMVLTTPLIRKYIIEKYINFTLVRLSYFIFLVIVFILSISSMVNSSYNPFIYFNF